MSTSDLLKNSKPKFEYDPNVKVNKEDLKEFIDEREYEIDRINVLYDFNSMPKYIVIRHIPIIFVIFLIIFGFLIYLRTTEQNEMNNIIIDKVLDLVIGITVIIASLYLWTVRTEYHFIIQQLLNKKQHIDKYIKNEDLKKIYNIIENETT
jgi:hypothetical protein